MEKCYSTPQLAKKEKEKKKKGSKVLKLILTLVPFSWYFMFLKFRLF